jgi:4'-phosphopantetheinyl transferase
MDRSPPPRGKVLCWRVAAHAIAPAGREMLFGLLDAGEQARADRFLRQEDRDSFTAAHGAVRLLLGQMLDRAPSGIEFIEGEFGKPRLAGAGDIDFNMSHSGGIVLIALTWRQPIGVDVELVRPVPERAAIVRRNLHPGEAADLSRFDAGEAEGAFFRCWSRKEAVVKALGRGLSLDLDRYRVACAPGAAPALLALDGEDAPNAWSIVDLTPGPGHVGAVAARQTPLAVSCRSFDAAQALP